MKNGETPSDEDAKTRLLVCKQVTALLDEIIANTTISNRSQAASCLIGRMTKLFIKTWVFESGTPDLASNEPPLVNQEIIPHAPKAPTPQEAFEIESFYTPMQY
jgi:hypothetical protein